MKLFWVLFLILFLAFSGYHLSFRGIRLPLFARKFYLTGTEFLFLGLLLGPRFLNLLDAQTLQDLTPFSALLLGWVGLLFGFQFEIKQLRRFPPAFFAAAALQSGWTLAMVLPITHWVLSALPIPGPSIHAAIVLTLGAAAACTAQTGMALMTQTAMARHSQTVRLLSYISGIDGLFSLIVFSLAFFCLPQPGILPGGPTPSFQGPLHWITTGAVLMFLYLLLLSRRREDSELMLLVIAMAIFTSGVATLIGFSPLILNFLTGVMLVNLSREKERIFQILLKVEKPVYLLLLVFLGVHWHMGSPWFFLLAAGFCLCRLIGKWMGGALGTRLPPSLRSYPVHLGFGLLESGGLPLAILLDFLQAFSAELTGPVVSVALLAVIYNDLASPHFMGWLLGDKQYARELS